MSTSQNGYRANDRSIVSARPIPGTSKKVTVRNGAPGDMLLEFAGWFDKNVEDIEAGIADDWGYAERPIRGSSTTLSNHASGTAIDLNATKHPLGRSGTFTPGQVARIRKELARYEGCIRWGGDYKGRKDEMHFEVNASPARCEQVLAKVRAENAANAKTPAKAPAKKAASKNHVTAGRALIRQGIAELRRAPKSRAAVHAAADELEQVYKKGPTK